MSTADGADGFLLSEPPWLLIWNPSAGAAGPVGPLHLSLQFVAGGERFVVAFTDEDLAQRFLRSAVPQDVNNLCVVQAPSMAEFARCLEALQQEGVRHVGFDVEFTHVRTFPIGEVIADLRDR